MSLLTQTSIFSNTQPLGGSPSTFDLGPSSTFQEGNGLLSSSLDINNGGIVTSFTSPFLPPYNNTSRLTLSNLDTNTSNHRNSFFQFDDQSSTLQIDRLNNTSLDNISTTLSTTLDGESSNLSPFTNSGPLSSEDTETITQIVDGGLEDINTSLTDLNIVSTGQTLSLPNTTTPTPFDKGKDSTLQQDSLLNAYSYQYGNSSETAGPVPGGDSNSPFQDLDGGDQGQGYFHGINNPGKGQGKQIKGEDLHVHLLQKAHTYNHGESSENIGPSPNKSEYQDLDGVDGGQGYFHGVNNPGKGQGKQLGSTDLHVHLLENVYTYDHGSSKTAVGPSPGRTGNSDFQDLDGVDGGQGYFHGLNNPGKGQGKQLGGADLHEAMLTDTYQYKHGNASSLAPKLPGNNSISAPPGGFYDLDGAKPSCYEHPETQTTYY